MTDFRDHISDQRALWLSRQVLPHEAALRAWLSSRRLPGVEIDDVVQETYARLITAPAVEGIRNPKTYAFQTAWSVLMTHVRRERVVSFQAIADIDQLGLEADQPSPEQQTADRQELLRLAQAMDALPGKIRDVFRLRRIEGLSQKEVAARLGLAESTVEKHMKRGLTLLMHRLVHGGIMRPGVSKQAGAGTSVGHAQGNSGRD